MANRQIKLPGGRKIGVSGSGDPAAARLVVFCHPTPGAGGFDPNPIITARWGVHMLGLDRPGYGASDPLGPGEHASFAARADDIATFITSSERSAQSLARTHFGQIGVVGWQTGGLTALALAARHPGLVDRIALIDTPAPPYPPLEGGPPFTLDYLGVSDDEALMRPGLQNRLERMLVAAALQGDTGFHTDQTAMSDDTELNALADVTPSTKLIYGEGHPLVPAADALWFQDRLPNATIVRVRDGRSHSIVTQWERILAHVAPHQTPAGSKADTDRAFE